jgi:diacylglycerol kinase
MMKTITVYKEHADNLETQEEKTTAGFLAGRRRSFGYALCGIIRFFRTEINARIHLAVTVVVIGASFLFSLSGTEVIMVVFSIAFVWITEMINTAIEKAMDYASIEIDPQIKLIKDIAAGAVLIAAITAMVVGSIVFLPKLFSL